MTEGKNVQTLQIRTFELVQSVTSFMEGTIDDWPANIQDTLLNALERKSKQVGLPLTIVMSRCDVDHDVAEGKPGRFFVHVIASEIVVADERFLAPGSVTRSVPDAMKKYIDDLGIGR